MAEQSGSPQGQGEQGASGFTGVFSRTKKSYIGTGTTRRKVEKTVYFFAREQEGGKVAVQALNTEFLPSGKEEIIELGDFVSVFSPEPELYESKTRPAMRNVSKSLAKGERLRSQGQPFTAEVAFKEALSIDSENVRGNFGLGLTYLDQGKNDEATQVLKKIVQLDGSYKPENKHLFNEFGIKLRKNGMFDQALSYYANAYKLAKDDENLCYNIARTLYEKGDLPKSLAYLEKALQLRPDFQEAGGMLRLVIKEMAG